MFIAISGMVGSGKSTAANRAVTVLQALGSEASVWRFQTLPCFTLLRSPQRPCRRRGDAEATSQDGEAPRTRWSGYQRKQLTAALTAVYLARILTFRAYRLLWRSDEWRVLNRYFYDLFVHLRLATPAERRYFALLRSMIPIPDVAVLVVASAETLAARRPAYSEEYLVEVAAAYRRLQAEFPELIEIRTDPGERGLERVDALLKEQVNARARPAAR